MAETPETVVVSYARFLEYSERRRLVARARPACRFR
jgi:hypothetical protein